MPRQRRKLSKTGTYHIMLRGNERKSIFPEEEDYRKFLQTLANKKRDDSFLLYAYCLMSNHLHLLIREKKQNISKIMKRINIAYAYYFNKKYNRVGHVFQDRFKSEPIEEEGYLLSVIRYIHNNPLDAKMVNDSILYPWSSYNYYINESKKNIIDKEEILTIFSSKIPKAIQLFKTFSQKSSTSIGLEYKSNNIPIKEMTNDEQAYQYIRKYLKEKNLTTEDISKSQNKYHRDDLIFNLKKKSNLSIRKIAEILGINRGIVLRIKV
jgi:REP element-mobilizing transposase RayT